MNRCRSCKAEVIWAEHARTGKSTPLDAEVSPDGTWIVTEQVDMYGAVKSLYDRGGPPGHKSHFATCPFADSHRKAKEPA